MATKIRPELSRKNKYYIDKHRHYELKHFCLQYPLWKKELIASTASTNKVAESIATYSVKMDSVDDRISAVEQAAREADCDLYEYILKAITEGLSYTYLKTKLNIPCSRDTYYDRYRRFFWILDKIRN